MSSAPVVIGALRVNLVQEIIAVHTSNNAQHQYEHSVLKGSVKSVMKKNALFKIRRERKKGDKCTKE